MLAESLDLSLREIEQFLTSINLALRTAKENEYVHPALLAFLIVVKNRFLEAYHQYISSPSEEKMVQVLHEIVQDKGRQERFPCALTEGFLIAAKVGRLERTESKILAAHKQTLKDENVTDEARIYSEQVIQVVNRPVGIGHSVNLDGLVARIEMLSQFKFPETDG